MDIVNYFTDLFESISDYRKTVLLKVLIQNDKNSSKEMGFSKNDNNVIILEFKKILLEEYENY